MPIKASQGAFTIFVVSFYLAMEDWSEPQDWDFFNASITDESFTVPWTKDPYFSSASTSLQCYGFPSSPIPDKATTISKSHSEAEKRRRDRINAQLAALRKLIPKSSKMDKAALLGSAVEHVKDLRQKANEVTKALVVPTESDQVTVYCEDISKDKMLIRASVCCEDRPEVFRELIQVLKGLKLSTVKAEFSSVGGRIKSDLILCKNNDDDDKEGHVLVLVTSVKKSLNVVVNRINALSSDGTKANRRIRSKRQRLLFASQFT